MLSARLRVMSMHLSSRALEQLAQMICGAHGNPAYSTSFAWPNFLYRSSYKLTKFFVNECGVPYHHDGSTRITWVTSVLEELDEEPAGNPKLPSDKIIRVIGELLDSVLYESPDTHQAALDDINRVLGIKDGLRVQLVNGRHLVLPISTLARADDLVPVLQSGHPNISILISRMDTALSQGDYAGVLHASASIFETMAKDVVGIPTVQNQTLKAFFGRYRKESGLPEEILDYILSIYESRNVTPLAGHGSTDTPTVTRKTAIALSEMSKAFVRIEYKLRER
jgi:hypothetical protein